MSYSERRVLGRTGLMVSRMGLGSGYKVPAEAVAAALDEYGINYFYWDKRHPAMASALRELGKSRRQEFYLAIQSYDHLGFWLKHSVQKALKKLGTDYADILYLGWHGSMPRDGVMEAALRLKERGLVRHLGITGHDRKFHGLIASKSDSPFDVQMVRYNAAHRGAEDDVFKNLLVSRPGIVSYTATRWGMLLDAGKMPAGEAPLTASECYRFVLASDNVDICLTAPKNMAELNEGMRALTDDPLSEDELERIRLIGDHIRKKKSLLYG